MKFTKVKAIDGRKVNRGEVIEGLQAFLNEAGFLTDTWGDKSKLRRFRIDIKKHGYNRHTCTGRRTRSLSWGNWIDCNALVNEYFDNEGLTANISTLGGKFILRRGAEAYTAEAWEAIGGENCGSVINPIARRHWITKA